MPLPSVSTLMVQGTTSDAGKSTLVTALCRYYYRQGVAVVPFKSQNMALNSAVTQDGGEIGRAQAVQASAAGLAPHTDMNPILLKPSSDKNAQVIMHGKVQADFSAQGYQDYKQYAMQAVLASHHRLLQQYAFIVVEGAGSPAEINLRDNDIANMGFAEAVDCPVILIADIDKGGVFAHFVGTLALLSATEQERVIGFVINRFRGDITLLESGVDWLEARTGKPVLAVLPYLKGLYLEAEDAVAVDLTPESPSAFRIVVLVLPRISNHTDFDALRLLPDVVLEFAIQPKDCAGADLIILPGSKSVRDDLAWLRGQGWDHFIARHLRYGGKLIGICGGYQMLGEMIHDPQGVEGGAGSSQGLGYLAITTTLHADKQLQQVQGVFVETKDPVKGYEIHAGVSCGKGLDKPLLLLEGKPEGAISDDNQVLGSYVHGLFDLPAACEHLLHWAGFQWDDRHAIDLENRREAGINLLADTLEQHFDFARLEQVLSAFNSLKRRREQGVFN